jgi:hypothetical protein
MEGSLVAFFGGLPRKAPSVAYVLILVVCVAAASAVVAIRNAASVVLDEAFPLTPRPEVDADIRALTSEESDMTALGASDPIHS